MNALPNAKSQPEVPTCPPDAGEDPRAEVGAPEPEWLETDGRGGYASLSTSWTPHRRYHGLLTAVPDGTERRYLFLAGLLDRLRTDSVDAQLTRVRVAGSPAVWPTDHRRELEAAPWHRERLAVESAVLCREVLVPDGRRAVLVRYALEPESECAVDLELEPLLAFREADDLTFANDVARTDAEMDASGALRFCLYDALPTLSLGVDGEAGTWRWEADARWHRGVEYATDLARGYGGHEDLLGPGRLHVRLRPGDVVTLAATIDDPILDGGALFEQEAERRLTAEPSGSETLERFAAASEAFLYVGPGERPGVLAGFPWFGEWGRDTFIALPGLTLARGDLAACADVLVGAVPYLRGGLLPNIFGTGPDDSHYGSADAALWFARAVLLYERAGGDEALLEERFLPALLAIAQAYRGEGDARTHDLGVRTDSEGGLHVGSPDRNPTWMDAQAAAGPVTPRHGCPVEINALWCSLLAHVADRTSDAEWEREAQRAGETFLERFWCEDEGVLADVWSPNELDRSIRPNMVLAAALELSPLDLKQRRRVVERAEADLLTPYGLRTLAPSDPTYRPRYQGDPESRDRAYHQGTVWPWLLGFFCEAALRLDPGPERRAWLRGLWGPLEEELERGGLGHVAEVYDGDAPHRRGGTFAQAWSTAEAMRALALIDGTLPPRDGGAP